MPRSGGDPTAATMLGELELSAVDQLSLGLSRTYYALARALRLNKLRDLLGSSITLDGEGLFLLGCSYSCPPNASEAQQEEVRAGHCPADTYRLGPAAAASAGAPPRLTAAVPPRRRPWRACCTTFKASPG